MIDMIERNRDRIAAACRRHAVKRLDLFGSAARGDFTPGASDVDLFYEFDPADTTSVADRFFDLTDELEEILGCKVDLVSVKDVWNPCFLTVSNRHRVGLYAA